MVIDFVEFLNDMRKISSDRNPENERHLLQLRDRISVAIRRAKEVSAELEEMIIVYMTVNQCVIKISDAEHLYVGTTRTTKSVDDQGILMAVLEKGNGNLELLTTGEGGVLASQPWKQGAVRSLIGDDDFAKYFEVKWQHDVKTGKTTKTVKTFSATHKTFNAFS